MARCCMRKCVASFCHRQGCASEEPPGSGGQHCADTQPRHRGQVFTCTVHTFLHTVKTLSQDSEGRCNYFVWGVRLRRAIAHAILV